MCLPFSAVRLVTRPPAGGDDFKLPAGPLRRLPLARPGIATASRVFERAEGLWGLGTDASARVWPRARVFQTLQLDM